jgi:hypothetical protein
MHVLTVLSPLFCHIYNVTICEEENLWKHFRFCNFSIMIEILAITFGMFFFLKMQLSIFLDLNELLKYDECLHPLNRVVRKLGCCMHLSIAHSTVMSHTGSSSDRWWKHSDIIERISLRGSWSSKKLSKLGIFELKVNSMMSPTWLILYKRMHRQYEM